ncbi:flavin-containing monooxygenase [Mycobacteroides abscessus]|uniref:flavin-containing monooxygenase n=1 Tax=Mycobacteroides abscessus TaxID=36809 RepID=UPI0021082618|nr:NAD(P)/FAD-dependent oxidoreductase [Mycobacteroides abscessus]
MVSAQMAVNNPVDVAIIGAGIAGLGMAARLRQARVQDLLILEQAPEIGGYWRRSTFSSVAGDELAVQQSYSFSPSTSSRTLWATREGVLSYQRDLIARYGLEPALRLRNRVTGLSFEQGKAAWRITVAGKKSVSARRVILAVGAGTPSEPPELAGIEQFEGPILSTADWDPSFDFAGRNVAVIAAGASTVHVVPELVKKAARVRVFQRAPDWVLPRWGAEAPDAVGRLVSRASGSPAGRVASRSHEALRRGLVWRGVGTRLVEAVAENHLNRNVKDPWLRRNLLPAYRAGSRRILFSDDFYSAIQQDNCKLVPWPVTGVSAIGVRSADAMTHKADCLVFALDAPEVLIEEPFPIKGVDGSTLGEHWGTQPTAFRGVNVPGFPNLFLLAGPGSGTNALAGLAHVEAQIDYVTASLALIDSLAFVSIEVRREALEREQARAAQRFDRTTWRDGAFRWYKPEDTVASELFPGTTTEFRRALADVDAADYKILTQQELDSINSAKLGVAQ